MVVVVVVVVVMVVVVDIIKMIKQSSIDTHCQNHLTANCIVKKVPGV